MNNVKKFVLILVAVIIFSVAARLLIRFVENTFNLDIDPLVRILIIGLSVVIAISIVNVKLAKKTKEGAKKGIINVSRFSLIPGLIPGLGMLIVAAVSTLWILNLGAEWSVVRLGTFAWAASVALKIAWAVLAHKPILNFLKSRLPAKLSKPFSWSYIGLLTGIFECGVALVFVLKFDILYQATWIDILAFGIGFGAFEAFAVGVLALSQIGQYLLRPESIPEKYREEKEEEESTLNNLSMLFVGPVERVSTLLIHVFSNVLIILAVQQNIYLLFWLSFGFKTLVDGIAGWLTLEKDAENVTKASQAWAHQAIFIVLGLISVAGIVLLQKIWYS